MSRVRPRTESPPPTSSSRRIPSSQAHMRWLRWLSHRPYEYHGVQPADEADRKGALERPYGPQRESIGDGRGMVLRGSPLASPSPVFSSASFVDVGIIRECHAPTSTPPPNRHQSEPNH